MRITSLKEAALKGDVNAQVRLGRAYFNGDEGAAKNLADAKKWFKLAAQQQNTLAGQYAQGRCYEEGLDVKKDEKEAVTLYRSAAEKKYAPAQNNLGVCYADSTDVAKREEAAKLYRLAADQGYAPAQFNLGVCYEQEKNVSKNLDEAIRLYTLAASQGNQRAHAALERFQAEAKPGWCVLQ